MRASFAVARGRARSGFAMRWAPPRTRNAPAADPRDAGRRRASTTRSRRWRSWEAEHDIYEGPHRELVRLSSARAEGPDLPADRRDRGRADHLAPRDRRRRAQLGLPLRLDPRREPHARGALHRRLLRRGRGLRLVHDQLGRRPRRRGLAADHVRDRRRARPLGARARPPARLARLAPGARRQRRLGPDPARRLRRAARTRSISTASSSASCIPRSRRSSPTSPTPRRAAGGEADAGMWEMRGEPRHHLSSKVLCWTALDRAVKLAPAAGRARARSEEWAAERDEIREAVLERGWSEKRQAYAQSFDSDELDAAAAADADRRLPARRPTSACARRSRRSRAT